MKNATSTKKSKAKSKPDQLSISGDVMSKMMAMELRNQSQPNAEVLRWRKEMEESKRKMFQHFNGKMTAVKLIEWLATANDNVATSKVLNDEERGTASNVLLHISLYILPHLMGSKASSEKIEEDLVMGVSGGGEGFDYAQEGIGSIGIAFLRQKGSSSPEYISGFMRPLSLFLEMLQIYRDYEDYKNWLWDAERKSAAA
jgi:hypothetical protein